MAIPGFTAEASVTNTMSKYRAGPNTALFTRGVTATFVQLFPFPWEKQVHCCVEVEGKIQCTYYYVPIWYACENISPGGPSCMVCRPPVYELNAY
jgi:hypothetical protein